MELFFKVEMLLQYLLTLTEYAETLLQCSEKISQRLLCL